MNAQVQPVVYTVEVKHPEILKKTWQNHTGERVNQITKHVVHAVKVEQQKIIKITAQRKESIQIKSIR